jgi:ABC-type transport system involved in cytochrome c biogenesis permease component
MTSGIGAAFTIAKKDLLTQLRKRFEIFSMFLFAMIAVILFSLTVDLQWWQNVPSEELQATIPQLIKEFVSGTLWVVIFFMGMFGFSPVFLSEAETGTLSGLVIAPVPAWSVYLGKVIYGFALMAIVEIFLIPIFSVLFGINLFTDAFMAVALLVLGTLDLAAIGSMASALTMPSESKATIFPLVYFIPATSALILMIEITRILLGVTVLGSVVFLFEILIAHLVAMLTLSATVFHFALTP